MPYTPVNDEIIKRKFYKLSSPIMTPLSVEEKEKNNGQSGGTDNDTLNLTILPISSWSHKKFLNLLLNRQDFESDVFARADVLTHLHTLRKDRTSLKCMLIQD